MRWLHLAVSRACLFLIPLATLEGPLLAIAYGVAVELGETGPPTISPL